MGCRAFALRVAPPDVRCCVWRRWCSGRRVSCSVGPGCLVCPWAAARPRAVRAASFARRVGSKPGQAPPPPTGTAAGPSGVLHTGGAWHADVWLGMSARCPVWPCRHPPALRPGRAATSQVSCQDLACRIVESTPNFARNSPMALSNAELRSLEFQRFWALLKLRLIELRATFLGVWSYALVVSHAVPSRGLVV